MSNQIISIAAINAFIAVAAGAFAAHVLKHSLSTDYLAVFHTAVFYQMVHALALFGLGLLNKIQPEKWIKTTATIMTTGIILFSGSLYALALSDIKWLGIITPFGGLCFLIAWLHLAISIHKQAKS